MDTVLGGLRQSLRPLGRSPGFTLECVLMLAVGIGASTALFCVTHKRDGGAVEGGRGAEEGR
ncbi:hypothetical protein [Myxococcus sp. AB056]|uniref:hypothetical protein n=1 Tax=Myxococcus sp. AB056 TaxID=2562792 RepID=UPI0011461B9C|nr:hypothetical protein [Myxococcus sp. AB056]